MRDLTQQALDTIKIIILASAVVLSVQYVFADWSGPTDNPPDGNPEPPVNVSIDDQEKTGPLYVGGLISRYGILIEDGGLTLGGVPKDEWPTSDDPLWTEDGAGNISYTAGDVSVGAGNITAGQGTFTEGVTVGTQNGDIEYLHLDNKAGVGDPLVEDCNSLSAGGKMYFDSSIGVLYLCMQGRSTMEENGWKPIFIDYASTQ